MTTFANDAVTERIRAEYLEMPGMSLTIEQVQRLCGVERAACAMVLDSLVASGFLYMKAGGTYARLTGESNPRPRPAKAHLPVASATVRRAS
ncbi:MAG: hypothetical protein HYX77_06660 [Acidobacteria bacterium]|nr:hypothetical protein [Acidobacteriota bacterium]